MKHDDDEDALAPIDLHAWRVPPPAALDPASLVARALSPAAAPRRSRGMWMFAALAIANIVLAALLVIVLSQRPQPAIVTVRPAGGGSADAQAEELLRHLQQEQRDLEEIVQLRGKVDELSQRVRDCEQTVKHDAPGPRHKLDTPPPPPVDDSCDEVSCVLTDNEGPCCAKFLKSSPPPPRPQPALPESLDRAAISAGIASVRAAVAACGPQTSAKGIVKVHVRVVPAGTVDSIVVERSPDAALGTCVTAAVQRATFPRTQRGGSFTYPFVF